MIDKKTISIIEQISNSLHVLEIENAKNSLKINAVIWILGAILTVLLPGIGFLIAFWVQHSGAK